MKIRTGKIALGGLFIALMALGAYVSLPVGPVPITFQNAFAVLAGLLLGPALGALCEGMYLVLGLCGLPIFSAGSGGIAALLHPSFGFIVGFILSAAVAGLIAGGRERPSLPRLLAASAAGMLAAYLPGLPYMALILRQVMHVAVTPALIFRSGFLLFVPGDAAKCLLGALLAFKAIPALARYRRPGLRLR